MSTARIVINVSNQEHSHANGLSGNYTVPSRKDGEEFGMLVVYDRTEIQDFGENRRAQNSEWAKASAVARDIIGRSDAASHSYGSPATKEKWGLLLCEAEPDLPRELEKALEEERAYLGKHLPNAKYVRDAETGMTVWQNADPENITREKERLSFRVRDLREDFESDCRKMVKKEEISRAKRNLQLEDQRLVAEGDRMWAGSEGDKRNINELHKAACIRLGQERPWCYVPLQLVDCPGCGAKIKENVLSCSHCAGWLDEGIEKLRKMPPKERSMKMYPDRYAEPVSKAS